MVRSPVTSLYISVNKRSTLMSLLLKEIERKERMLAQVKRMAEDTETFVNDLDAVGSRLDLMGSSTEQMNLLLANWKMTTRAMYLGSAAQGRHTEADFEAGRALPEQLVRIPLGTEQEVGDDEKADEGSGDAVGDESIEETASKLAEVGESESIASEPLNDATGEGS